MTMNSQILGFLAARMKEPSTYAGIAALLAGVGITHAPDWAQVVAYAGMAAGTALAIFIPEGSKK